MRAFKWYGIIFPNANIVMLFTMCFPLVRYENAVLIHAKTSEDDDAAVPGR